MVREVLCRIKDTVAHSKVRIVAPWLSVALTTVWLAYPKLRVPPAPVPRPLGAPPVELDNNGLPQGLQVVHEVPLRWGDTLESALARCGVETEAIRAVLDAVDSVFDPRKFRAGAALEVERILGGPIEAVRYVIDPDRSLQVRRSGDAYIAEVIEHPYEKRVVRIQGQLEESLFESMLRLGERADLALAMAEIFAWDIDFYTDPQPGDEFSLLVEKKVYLNGQPPTYGRILAARYINAGKLYEGFLFTDEEGEPQYYDRNGRSLKAAFLRSPLKFSARISSRFSFRRFHPVLKIYRPHLGIDYAAPVGTPVQAIASGEVTAAGYFGAGGNTVCIRHANGYESRYLHLSRIAVRRGQKVTQGQVIGYVGATGLATGPHLDFRLLHHGRYLNFEQLRPPRAQELPPERMAAFRAQVHEYARWLDQGPPAERPVLAGVKVHPKRRSD